MSTRKSRIQVELVYLNGVLRKVLTNSRPPNFDVRLMDFANEKAYAKHVAATKYHAAEIKTIVKEEKKEPKYDYNYNGDIFEVKE